MSAVLSPHKQQLVWIVSRLYQRFGQISDKLHAAHGISSADRSLLLMLADAGGLTVSEIARERAVTRQFIQRMVNSLLERGLVKTVANVKHRRSPKLALTADGANAAEQIKLRELPFQRVLHESLELGEVEQMLDALGRFDAALSAVLSGRESKGVVGRPGGPRRKHTK